MSLRLTGLRLTQVRLTENAEALLETIPRDYVERMWMLQRRWTALQMCKELERRIAEREKPTTPTSGNT